MLIPAQVATCVTYKRLWRTLTNEGVGTALVIEDDVVFTEYAPRTASQLLADGWLEKAGFTPDREVLLRLGWALGREHRDKRRAKLLAGEVRMANPCFAVTHALAERLATGDDRVDTTADIILHDRVGSQVSSYTVMPPLAFDLSRSLGQIDSLIHPKQKRVSYLEQHHPADKERIEAARSAVARHVAHVDFRSILVVGHPRCGSGYMSALFKALGLDVKHEAMGRDGISSWMFAVDADSCPYGEDESARRKALSRFRHTVHHVRDPREAIPSIIRENLHSPESYAFRRRFILEHCGVDLDALSSDLERAVASYVHWNRIIEQTRPDLRVRVEDAEQDLTDFARQRNLVPPGHRLAAPPPRDVNSNKAYKGQRYAKPDAEELDWASLDSELAALLRDCCERYGYGDFSG